MEAGECMGEISLISAEAHTADVTALSSCSLLQIAPLQVSLFLSFWLSLALSLSLAVSPSRSLSLSLSLSLLRSGHCTPFEQGVHTARTRSRLLVTSYSLVEATRA